MLDHNDDNTYLYGTFELLFYMEIRKLLPLVIQRSTVY